ncbi:MAG: penicillin-binding protein 1A [Vicinamibacterales bacterium]
MTLARLAILVAVFAVTAIAGSLSGVLFAFSDDLPQITALDDYQPNTITRVVARDGRVIGEYATERRVVVGYDDLAPALRNAIIATEDAGFNQHFGLSVSRILVTLAKDILTGQRAGASTLTQQLARNLFPIGFEKTAERKIKEALIAIQLEKRYTKREIFALYANQIYMGHGAYGVEAASRLYFDKPASELSIEEAATIAAIIQAPERLSPFVNPQRALARRNYVIGRMHEEGLISAEEAQQASDHPLVVQGQPAGDRSIAPYFVEEVRQLLEAKYGAKALYEAGLTVQTTLDPLLQESANRAVDRGLRRLDKRRGGYRAPARNVLEEKHTLEGFTAPRWSEAILDGDIVPAVVIEAPGGGAPARVRIGDHIVEMPRAAWAWTRRGRASDLFKPGDLIDVEVRSIEDGVPQTIALEQAPLVEGALLAIDNRSGQIRAMVGGFSFLRSKFNRAVQARRQMGSVFKPIIFTAAIDRGYTPVSIFIDEPVSYEAGPNQPPYRPQNYDRRYLGPITLRHALEDSRNIPAVKAVDELGPRSVIEYATRFGFPGSLPPYLSLALGSAEASLLEVTSAYSAFPNHGVRMVPYSVISISDRESNVLEENRPDPREAIRADTAYVITNLMEGVVQSGTAAAARSLNWPLAGKTGTMDEYTDAWFVGFDPNITVGVWVGYDEKKPLGRGETGAQAALPIWIDFMRDYIEARADRENPPMFEAPGNIVLATLPNGRTEVFINGTQPANTAVLPASQSLPATP